MSFIRPPVYECEVCGTREIAKQREIGWSLPDGWHGSSNKDGACFCQKCYKCYKIIKEAEETNKKGECL